MDITIIDEIIKWIPFKSLRNNLREYMYFQFKIYEQLKNYTVDKENIKELILLKHQEFSNNELMIKFRENLKNDKNFRNRYVNLIKNIDDESIKVISNILSKICKYNNVNDPIYFEYYELKEINDIAYRH